ncbi:MAG: acetolactate synthase large subunit [Candidatus Eremiobacteraeota bacterium]|nr:acetolactate synthase large subunit [Candidatus Eremiobacteraeota bacterium]
MKASDLFVHCLEKEGVEYIFGLPGEENMDLLESLRSSSIQFITTRHEQGAAFMADVYGRLTGKAGVCLSTLGPGATNLVTGIADATLDRAPLVAITGQASLEKIHKESHQYIDVVENFRPITKWNARIEKPEIIPEVIRKGFKLAQSEKPGSCHIEVPEDVAGIDTSGSPLPSNSHRPTPGTDKASAAKALQLIAKSDYPIILAGNGVIRGRAAEALQKFAEKTRIPVAHTFMGKGVLPFDHELNLLSIGLQAHDYVNCGFDKADLILAIGYDLVEYAPKFWNPHQDKIIIHLDFTPAEVDAHYFPEVEMVGDIQQILSQLTQEANPGKSIDCYKALRDMILSDLQEGSHNDSYPLKPQRILYDTRQVMGKEDILISDVGAHKIWVARMYPAYKPNTVIISNGFASMGIALPGAIAAKLVYPEKKVLALVGDGGFLMNVQELETACRLGTRFVCLIFNDGGYGLIDWKQIREFGRERGSRINNPDFVKLAESFGAKGYRIGKAKELIPVLEEAFSQAVPSIIDCPVDYSENLKLTQKLGNLVISM